MDDIKAQLVQYNRLCRGYDEIYRRAALQSGIPFVSFFILSVLCSTEDAYTQSDINKVSFYPRQTINSAVSKLAAEGYLTLRPMEGNRKAVELTDAGRKFCESNIMPVIRAEEEAFTTLTSQERTALLTVMQKSLSLFRASAESVL